MGTGKSGSSLNRTAECPNRTIANSMWTKLMNAGLLDEFWCFAAEDSNSNLRHVTYDNMHCSLPSLEWGKARIFWYENMGLSYLRTYVVDTIISRTKLAHQLYVGHLTNPGTYLISQFPHVPSDALYVRLHGNKHTTILDILILFLKHMFFLTPRFQKSSQIWQIYQF